MHHRRQARSIVLLATFVAVGSAGCKEEQARATVTSTAPDVPAPPSDAPPLHAAVASPPTAPAAPPVSPETARAIERSCAKICEHSTALHCPHASDCTPNCLAMAIGTPCADEFAGLYRCLESEPSKHWECAEDGVAAVREGYCEKEQGAAVSCMEAKAR
jgi:hypothetical protein